MRKAAWPLSLTILLAVASLAAVAEAHGQGISESTIVQPPAKKPVATKPLSAAALKKQKSQAALNGYLDAQLAREKAKQRLYYESLAKNATETGQRDVQRIRAQSTEKNVPVYVPNDNAYRPFTGVPSRSPVYVSQDLEYAKMKEAMAKEKADALRKVANEKEAALQESMENMKSQMKESHVPGAAVARPEGSNLFVRYYGPSPTTKPYEVHPAAARIVPHQ